MKARKKVLFFLPNSVGGAERMTLIYAGFAEDNGYTPIIVVVGPTDREIRRMVEDKFPVLLIKVRNIWDLGTFRILQIIRKENPCAVFSSFHYLNARIILFTRLIGDIRVVVRSENNLNTVNRLTRFLVKWSYPKADTVVAQTNEMKEELCSSCMKHCESKVVVLNNPVPKTKIDRLVQNSSRVFPDDGKINIVSVGRISRQKGQDILIQAFDRVHKYRTNTILHILGGCIKNEAFREELNNSIVSFGIKDSVFFYGNVENPYPMVRDADCFVLSSRWEGLPNALIEAQYLRVPSVSTSCIPAISHIVKEGVTGYIVPPENPDSLAEGILKALDLKEIPFLYHGATAEDFCSLLS